MTKAYVYLYIVLLVVVNLVFALLPVRREEQVNGVATNTWAIAAIPSYSAVDMKQLLSSGFWGKLPSTDPSIAGAAGTQKEVDAQEANKLRGQIKAIINTKNVQEVLIGSAKQYSRVQKGQHIPGSGWILIDIGNDWLKLSKDGSDSTELLKLFSAKPGKPEKPEKNTRASRNLAK